MRLSANTQARSYMFTHSCMVKYAIGEEIRNIPTFDFKDSQQEIEITTNWGANQNEKRSGFEV